MIHKKVWNSVKAGAEEKFLTLKEEILKINH